MTEQNNNFSDKLVVENFSCSQGNKITVRALSEALKYA